MEQQPPESAAISRGQNAVHVVPGDWAAAPAALARLLDRVAADADAVQAIILVADADAAVGVVEAVVGARGRVPPRVVAATGAARTARVLRAGAAPVVVGAPAQVVALMRASALKIDQVRGLAVAWVEEILAAGGGPDLEAIMAEIPKDVPRTVLTAALSPAVEDFIERYARRAPRFGVPTSPPAGGASAGAGSTTGSPPALDHGASPASPPADQASIPLGYVLTIPAARPTVLRRLLDEIDPPSAAIYVRTDESERAVRQALLLLGYHGDSAALRVVRGAVTDHSALLVLYDVPHDAEELMGSTGGIPGRTLALLLPRQLGHLNALTHGPVRPFVFAGPAEAARGREEATRAELRRELAAGSLAREVLSLEPLLAEFDGVALAAAALRLLERQRNVVAAPPAAPTVDRPVVRPPVDSRAATTSDRPFARPAGGGGHGPPRSGGSGGARGGFGSGGSRGGGGGSSARGDSRDSRGGRGGPPGRGRPGAGRDGGRRTSGEGGAGRSGGERPPSRSDTRPLPRSPR